jgi:hypothetical protein
MKFGKEIKMNTALNHAGKRAAESTSLEAEAAAWLSTRVRQPASTAGKVRVVRIPKRLRAVPPVRRSPEPKR